MTPQQRSVLMPEATTHRAVIPFYLYASLSFLVGTVLLFSSTEAFTGHYYQPQILAITHIMALGWGTMMILGASHQLVPVLTEQPLSSIKLANASFWFVGIGIPLLVYGFYVFNMGWPAKWGGRLVVIGVACYLVNVFRTVIRSGKRDVHAWFILTAAIWLFSTTTLGLILVYNHSFPMLPRETMHYLPMHAHAGILGWFLMLVIGVASRLLPMFLISKYSNKVLMGWIYALINIALILFLCQYLVAGVNFFSMLPVVLVLTALLLFGFYVYNCFIHRIRKQVDEPMKLSIGSVALLFIPVLCLLPLLFLLVVEGELRTNLVLVYGFVIFFGWLSAIILGMTFKTLPFIVWNKTYRHHSGNTILPDPKSLFHAGLFVLTAWIYLIGFLCFAVGIISANIILLNLGSALLVVTGIFYTINVFRITLHKPIHEIHSHQ